MLERKVFTLLAALLFVIAYAAFSYAEEVPRMSKEDLKAKLGDKNTVVIDVRQPGDWAESGSKIQGAVREDPNGVTDWAKKYKKDKTLVLYCAWVNEATSARVAQKLIDMGYSHVFALKGGWREWEAAKFPMDTKK